jgi:hypothetical protein
LGFGGAGFTSSTVIADASGFVGLVLLAGLAEINSIGGREVVVCGVVTAQR